MLNVIYNNKHLNNLDKTRPVVLALSGGVDSMVLFYLLLKADFKVIIAHVNHHKRDESDLEEDYIKKLAIENNLAFEVLHYHHEKDNFQAEAHNSRYEFFYDVAIKHNASAIITAHHYKDNLETIFINLIRGSNLYGYAGIKELTTYKDKLVIRPLINVDKKDLYNYAQVNNIKYFEDSSNDGDLYLRNRIRHHLIPKLEKENPNLATRINSYSTQLLEAFEFIRNRSIKYLEENDGKINILTFKDLSIVEKKDIINYICDKHKILSTDNKICDILELIENKKPNLEYDLNNEYLFVKSYNCCYLSKKIDLKTVFETIDFGETINIENYGSFTLSDEILSDTHLVVAKNESLPLKIRTRLDGDKLIIRSGHKKLKDFLIDKKVPKEIRNNLLIVTNSLNEIIWVMGYYKKKTIEDESLILSFKEIM